MMTIDQLKDFGYNITEVTGWKNGDYTWYLRDKLNRYRHDTYSVYKTEEAAWKAAARHYSKNFDEQFFALLKEKKKLQDAHYKEMNALTKKAKALGYTKFI